VAAISAGVGDDPDLHCGKSTVTACSEPYLSGHLVARRRTDELLFAREFPFHRPPGPQRGEHAEILGQHLLLAAKAAADPLGENVHVARTQTKDVAEFLLSDERRL